MMGTKVANLNATVGKGFMKLFVTHEGQTWDINPYVSAVFENGTLVVFSKENRDITFGVEKAAPGELFHVQVFGHEKKPLLKKGDMPHGRGNKILWAMSFVEPEKRASSEEDFYAKQPEIEAAYGSDVSILHSKKGAYAIFLAKKRPQPGKGRKSHQVKYKPCLGWCSDSISDEDLENLVREFRRHRKIYCPVEFLSAIK